MFPSRLDRSTVQNDRIMCCAFGEITGSWGNRTGFSMILGNGWHVITRIQGKRGNLLFVYFNRVLMPERGISGKKLIG